MTQRLAGAQRRTALAEIHGWSEVEDRDAIRKVFHFGSFREAIGFLVQVALLAERRDHHPEIFNNHARVELVLSTGDVDGLSERDIGFARAVDEIAPARDR